MANSSSSTHNHNDSDHDSDHGSFARNVARIVGIVFLLVGVLGFIPGITTNYDTMKFAGHESEALLLGLFQVSVLHNIVHLLFGVGVVMSKNAKSAIAYLIGGGAVYAIVWIYGLLTDDKNTSANFLPFNSADNVLHFVLAVGMIALGLIAKKRYESHDNTAHTHA